MAVELPHQLDYHKPHRSHTRLRAVVAQVVFGVFFLVTGLFAIVANGFAWIVLVFFLMGLFAFAIAIVLFKRWRERR